MGGGDQLRQGHGDHQQAGGDHRGEPDRRSRPGKAHQQHQADGQRGRDRHMARRVVEGGGLGRPAGHQRLQQQLGRERARRRQQRQRHRIPSPHDHPGGRGGGQDPHDGEPSQPVRDLLGQPELVVGTGAEPVLDPRVQAWELLGVPDEPGDQGGDENGEDGRGRRPWRSQQGVTRRNEDRAAAPCVTAGHGSTGPHPVLSTSGTSSQPTPARQGASMGRSGRVKRPSRDPATRSGLRLS